MPDPTIEDLYDALTSPWTARLSPDVAAAHLLAAGADGAALRELAALSERDVAQAVGLVPAAYEEAAHLLVPVRALRDAQGLDQVVVGDTVVIAWSSSSIGDRIEDLGAFLDDLARAAARLGLGEVEGPVDEAEEQVAFCYGDDVQALHAFVLARLPAAPLPHASLTIRSGR